MALLQKKLTVDGIVADFTKKIEQLERVAAAKAAEISKQDAAIAAAKAAQAAAESELTKANTVASKIKALLS